MRLAIQAKETQGSFLQSKTTLSIGIAAPSAVPFVVGGAEKLWWGMQEYINRNTAHNCELIKVCAPEDTFRDLILTYNRFYHLDLLHFDVVLTTKYPAWMVRHPNHHIYFQHPLRGLYELYHGPENLPAMVRNHPGVKKIYQAVAETSVDVPRLLERCLNLAHDPSAPEEALALPGPLLRHVVRALDHHAINRAVSVSAISKTVKARSGYFPDPGAVGVIHHPSNLDGFHDAGSDYLLTASRLVRSKRIHLILDAYLRAGLDIPLIIAGRGPELPFLQKMAAGVDRVRFTGFVSDRDLVALYARARAIVFIPENEDLGLITLEAMASGKPVITCADSGGATELVQHGQNGWICAPEVKALAEAMQAACADCMKTAAMGMRARDQVRRITWEKLFSSLFQGSPPSTPAPPGPQPAPRPAQPQPLRRSDRPALAVLSTFPVYPPHGGGQVRIYQLYRALAADFDVHLVSLGPERDRADAIRIAPGLKESRVPMPYAFLKKARRLGRRLGIPAVDLAVLFYPVLLPAMAEAVAKAAGESDLVILSHPYALPLARQYAQGKQIYEAHNVEYDIKKAVLNSAGREDATLQRLREIEQEACTASLFTMACSEADIARLGSLYGLDPSRALVVPNGVDPSACVFTAPEQKPALQQSLGIESTPVAVFMGSDHPPNNQAAGEIIRFAGDLPAVRFIIIGSVADHFKNRPRPDNVGFTGVIAEAEKALYLACAHVALNPVRSGSGTNLKMLEYIASGLPVISTPFGARGLDVSTLPVIVRAIEDFPESLNAFDDILDVHRRFARPGRRLVESEFSWQASGRKLAGRLKQIMAVF